MRILVIAEHDRGQLKTATRSAIAAAKKIGGEIHVLVAGSNPEAVVEQVAQLSGVTTVKVAKAVDDASLTAENLGNLTVANAAGYSHILAAATTFGKNLLPRIAALLDVAPVSDIVAIEDSDTFVRPIYAGSALATVRVTDPLKVVTVRPTAFPAVDTEAGKHAAVEIIAPITDSGQASVVKRELHRSARPELDTARVVVAGGRGLGSAENFSRLLEPLADKLGAALGASRAAVDAGFATNDHQVGQTGKIVAPDLYIAVGVSGAIQHLTGMKDAKVIVAINKDPDAPIFKVADYCLEADLFDVIPEFTARC